MQPSAWRLCRRVRPDHSRSGVNHNAYILSFLTGFVMEPHTRNLVAEFLASHPGSFAREIGAALPDFTDDSLRMCLVRMKQKGLVTVQNARYTLADTKPANETVILKRGRKALSDKETF